MDQYYYRSAKGESGPYSRDELVFLLRSGTVERKGQIRHGLVAPWLPVEQTEFAKTAELVDAKKNATSTGPAELSVLNLPVSAMPSAGQRVLDDQSPTAQMNRPSSDARNQWIAGLITTAIAIAILLIGIWLRSQQALVTEPGSAVAPVAESAAHSDVVRTDDSAPLSSEGETESPVDAGSPNETAAERSEEPLTTVHNTDNEISTEPEQEQVANAPLAPANALRIRLLGKAELHTTEDPGETHTNENPALRGSDLNGRQGARKSEAIRKGGGTPESEAAVALALEWLKRVQQSDGSWRFDRVGDDAQPGTLQSPAGATALAMLCFLGAGNTTSSGPQLNVVQSAFEFLELAAEDRRGQSDTMYVHALVLMCFSELAAMDPSNTRARRQAESLLTFIEKSQDPRGGGWRYLPREAGDLSVTGWQVMALQSARTCKLKVSDTVVVKASAFLDSVSRKGGSTYCYTPGSGSSDCMTAVGLLSRIYLGSPRNSRPLQTGLREICKSGPDRSNIYFNYYATLAVHHMGGELWEEWNPAMRTHLVNTQILNGNAAGSWPVTDPHGMSAGQIYQTCLSTLCLEVYYRYLPMFESTPHTPE